MSDAKEITTSGQGRLRQFNRRAVLSHIRYKGSNSRLKLGKQLGLSAAAITSVVNELLNDGLLKNSEALKPLITQKSKPQGRPISLLELQAKAASVFGLILRPTGKTCAIELAWADYTGHVTTLDESSRYDSQNLSAIIQGIIDATSKLEESILNVSQVFGITIGIPGVVEDNNIPIAPKLKCIEGTEFMHQIREALPYPVSFQNDVNLGALSELHQQPRLRDLSFAYLHVYSGVGSSIVIKGEILNGSRGWAGEIGQLFINHNSTQQASFERLLSVDGTLADLLEELNHPRHALSQLVPYIKDKNKHVLTTIDEYCENLCNAIRVLHYVLDLDEIMIDFPSAKLFKSLHPKLLQIIQEMPHKLILSTPTIEHQADLHGAALFALNQALDNIESRKSHSIACK